IASVDEETGWGAWADEYYYIYPDGAAVRHFTVHGLGGCSITEPTVLNQPGEKAEDNVELAAVTMANMKGEMRTHTWNPWPSNGKVAAPFTNALPGANICMVNLKSKSKPFYIYEPGTRIIPYGGGLRELRKEYSRFPTWNHWPVSDSQQRRYRRPIYYGFDEQKGRATCAAVPFLASACRTEGQGPSI
ncbi:MAG: hypothetical protein ACYSYL_19835, partial [Planctomycetota bacterium]